MTTTHRIPVRAKFLFLSAAVIVLSACSTVRIAYQQLDWFIEKQVGEYVTLDEQQSRMLEAHVEALLDWHCATQVRGYGKWLRRVSDDIRQPVSAQQLLAHSRSLEDAWYEIMARSIPALAALAGSLSDDQVAELLTSMERGIDEYHREFIDPPDTVLRKKNAKWMRTSLKRWLGSLTEEQKDRVNHWSLELRLMGAAGLRNRVLWHDELAELLEYRHDRKLVVAGLERLLLRWPDYQGTEYRRRYERNSKLTAELLADISALLTTAQKHRLRKRALRYATDLEALHCAPAGQGATAGRSVTGNWFANN